MTITITLPQAPADQSAPPTDYTILPPPGRPWTAADVLALHSARTHRYELVQGELRQMSLLRFWHSVLNGSIIGTIGLYLQTHPIGLVVPWDAGFTLQTDPLTVRSPDVAFVAAERLPPDNPDAPAFPHLAPDLAVEVISPSETATSIAERVSDYVQAGTRLLWLVYPERQEVQEFYQGQFFHIYRLGDTLDGRDVLPNFGYPLDELFQ